MKPKIQLLVLAALLGGGIPQAYAEPPIQISPLVRDLLKGGLVVGGAIGKAAQNAAPTCSEEMEQCWEHQGMNSRNVEQIMDACWHASTHCSEDCKAGYFHLRASGMSAPKADDSMMYGEMSCGSH